MDEHPNLCRFLSKLVCLQSMQTSIFTAKELIYNEVPVSLPKLSRTCSQVQALRTCTPSPVFFSHVTQGYPEVLNIQLQPHYCSSRDLQRLMFMSSEVLKSNL
eukprot:TRINITY_DN5358_c0_g1_i6.p2 TRINITY_DN5358_c0_g1~~TRINITY_DN5358_c0_g1_i6.p2  ORF type:complete len:103 (+),score=11.72 TRINITY_DN5358_c0_g1_i6:788-1096(+)